MDDAEGALLARLDERTSSTLELVKDMKQDFRDTAERQESLLAKEADERKAGDRHVRNNLTAALEGIDGRVAALEARAPAFAAVPVGAPAGNDLVESKTRFLDKATWLLGIVGTAIAAAAGWLGSLLNK